MLIQAEIPAEISSEIGLVTLFQNLSVISWVVLVTLLLISIWSWGVILSKSLLFRRINSESKIFWKLFRRSATVTEAAKACQAEELRFTPLFAVLMAGMEMMRPRSSGMSRGSVAVKTAPRVASMKRAMQRTATAELTALEQRLPFLATTAAVAPFVGLFGTVWGVLTSFLGLSNETNATLQAVGPGIAEALIATAFGLAAAIPAVVLADNGKQFTVSNGTTATADITLATGDTVDTIVGKINAATSTAGNGIVASNVNGSIKLTSASGDPITVAHGLDGTGETHRRSRRRWNPDRPPAWTRLGSTGAGGAGVRRCGLLATGPHRPRALARRDRDAQGAP